MSNNLKTTDNKSKGRKFPEKPHPYRSDFERDRDRIIHSEAFRRLEGKTQVFLHGLNDNYRNRLTHSLEVAQIGRTIAKNLDLNETLTEAICLGHDLGHSPFGHSGEKVLDNLADEIGGFEHNRQTLRVVELLEHPYPDFEGLNLMYETRLGLAKHSSPYDISTQKEFTENQCSLEGQIADIADRIAYNCHDLEDGMRIKLLDERDLKNIDIYKEAQDRINAENIEDKFTRSIRTAKAIIDILATDCINSSSKNIEKSQIKMQKEIFSYKKTLVGLSPDYDKKLKQLEEFLFGNLYMHKQVIETSEKTKVWLEKLFYKICEKPELMPKYFYNIAKKRGRQRTICDYIAGMTDQYCIRMLKNIED